MKIGDTHHHRYLFTQQQVQVFATLTGDDNPLHIDAEFAATTPFKRPIMHGMLSASVFAKVFGRDFGGSGGVHLSQMLEFVRPMYPDVEYEARFECKAIDTKRHTAEITCTVIDPATNKTTLRGVGLVFHKDMFS
ncbi:MULTISPECIES: MaoC family dehydratase [Spirosoma]|uniref:MaoC family dehydratase n=1 Tax=Spirosoma liriopis TaxID=2937440 RepID=A0ABT0HLB6_9BACT|nr:MULTISPECIES: MaoC family dehydratase [Spirosoma]MCK8492959.1 MaoC family dehydratase [Spirosoma liriopis]UHG92360.1 MaoC family dehydratase [Spirosoma oryzicola]